MAQLFLVIPAGAEGTAVEILVAELVPQAGAPGFAALAISKARGLGKLPDSAALISALLGSTVTVEDSKDLYVELASMQELLGRYEEAAESWEAAAVAQPGKGDPSWLVSAAACRLATGDAEAATALSRAALLTTTSARLVALAMLIEARALILSGDLPGALARSLDALAVQSSGLQAAALSVARDASDGAERASYEKRLRTEFPGWPVTNDALAIFSGLVHSTSTQPPGSGTGMPLATVAPAATATGGTVDVRGSVSNSDRLAEKVLGSESKPLYYQLGAFRDEANATLLSTRLVRAGFKPETARKEMGTGILSIVYLEAGADPGRLMIALKDAGFESWPLFAKP
ncbi:MAG: SPOR domain-containing protein [Clostridia bacterium]|nr:hypothetical protein [Spirochaetia bacterium]